ncbi:uncharacterized protein LOC116351446 [Contarinia nasturtii]|uniref:uncharacterized protein LOC116351446 n=1 Tax=Contarinia nasturtii TaxID=265458 RepID=UPI0012D4B6DD|nr:uncharacterized protein LOC116351446 [Contarinia nasturtii]
MSHKECSTATPCSIKVNQLSQLDLSLNQMSLAAQSIEKQPSPIEPSLLPAIFSLHVDCFFEIFEYLGLKDLHSFGKTCKQMHKVAGEYFMENYSAVKNVCELDRIHTCFVDKNGRINKSIQTSNFLQYMPILSIRGPIIHSLYYLCSRTKDCVSTIHICFIDGHLSIEHNFIKNIFHPQIETIQSQNVRISGDFHELALKFCTNLKRLYLQRTSFDDHHYTWLLNDYPNLLHLEITPIVPFHANGLNNFFTRNANVQRFSTTPQMLWHNKDTFLNSTATLDTFEIKEFECYGNNIESIWCLLNQLYKKGFYKRVFIYIKSIDAHRCTQLASVDGLDLLCIQWFSTGFNLSIFSNLKELIILDRLYAVDIEHLARSLATLERLYVKDASIDDIVPFIRLSPTLKKMKVIPRDRKSFNGAMLDIAKLNKERAELTGARKLTIYTRDDVFLTTKWNTKDGNIDQSFLKIRRMDSYEWEHQYCDTYFIGKN